MACHTPRRRFSESSPSALVLAGACTTEAYGRDLERQIRDLGIGNRVLITAVAAGDPRLIGLIQESRVVLLPSISENVRPGSARSLAAGTTVISSRTSGASALIRDGDNGWLFDFSDPRAFHQAISQTLLNPGLRARLAESGVNS